MHIPAVKLREWQLIVELTHGFGLLLRSGVGVGPGLSRFNLLNLFLSQINQHRLVTHRSQVLFFRCYNFA